MFNPRSIDKYVLIVFSLMSNDAIAQKAIRGTVLDWSFQLHDDDLLANVDILIPNVTEAEIISGMHITDDESAKEAIRYISSKGIKTVIITMGAKGALAYENNEFIHIPAFKVEAVDTTAAGDTFCGGLCVALSEGKNLKDAIIFASKASSISVTRIGAQVSIPLRKEIQ